MKSPIALSVFVILSIFSATLFVKADQKDDEIAALREQVRYLVAENQALRRQLIDAGLPKAKLPPERAPRPGRGADAKSAQQSELTHWLTTSSNKRHNYSCRNFRTTKGRPCRKDEGTACGLCGG